MSHADPYADYPAGQAPSATTPAATSQEMNDTTTRGRSRSRSPVRNGGGSNYRSPRDRSPATGGGGGGGGGYRRRSPGPRKPNHAPTNPTPSNVLGVFGLSIRTQERDLEDEFSRFGTVSKVTIVYDQRTDRSRGFGFIVMGTVEDAARCVQELNGVELNGRRIRVDYSVTERPHQPTPGEYMGLRRSDYGRRDDHRGGGRRDDRGRYDRDDRDHRRDDHHRDRDYRRDDRDRDYRRGDDREYRDRRSSPPPRGSGGGGGGGGGGGSGYGRYSPRRRSYSPRSPPRAASPGRHMDTQDAPRW